MAMKKPLKFSKIWRCIMTNNNQPKGRKPKGKETRKAVTFRLQPSTISIIREAAVSIVISQSDLIESIVKDLEV